MTIKDWYYQLDENTNAMDIYVISIEDEHLLASIISDCGNMSDTELELLAEEIIEELEYNILSPTLTELK